MQKDGLLIVLVQKDGFGVGAGANKRIPMSCPLDYIKINFHKSELFCFGEAKQYEQEYAQLISCRTGIYPFKYLGIPMHTKKLGNKDWQAIEDRFEKKLSCWKEKLLSVGGHLVLINSVLSSLPMFMMSF